ncbi:pectin methylesterase inhibitor 5 [Hibiscus trionum]|uniref:Pectin methylesterase inhibitor 5 n=1 Tax=Hibiscus trionum TaxID=183268 RepID=A0A9W7GX49_HIBTR|nr:pectin methylesterase inhibitor 5 [Hibiscus trionum]
MGSFKSLSCMAIIFLLISYSFNGCIADPALIDSICKPSEDYAFCISRVGNDPRAATADLHGLALISISVTAIYIQETLDKIYELIHELKDPVTQSRLTLCQSDYNEALSNFQSSFTTTSRDSFFEAIDFVRIGTNKVMDCHNRFMTSPGPVPTSPIAEDDTNVFKFSGIIMIAIDKNIPKK